MCQANVKSQKIAVGCQADSQSNERTVGRLAQGMACGELGKHKGQEEKSVRTTTGYGRINKGIRRWRAKG